MSWKADQIYTKPNSELINYLRSIDGFSDELFLVDNLDGIRDNFSKDFIFSEQKSEFSIQKHSLPDEGLLVIKPKVYATGYDIDYETNIFLDKYKQNPHDKWDFINKISEKKFELPITLNESQLKLLSFLHMLSDKFNTPIVYYYCSMWGGEIDEEYSIVFDKGATVYEYDYQNELAYQLIDDKKIELDSTLLQTTFKHLNVKLPTWYFALHVASFDWQKYHLKKKDIL